MNYGATRVDITPEPQPVEVSPKKRRAGRVIGFILGVCGLFVALSSIAFMMPNWIAERQMSTIASDFKFDNGSVSDKAADAEAGEKTDEVDWERLREFNEHAEMWIEVPGRDIDFPVLQGDDNDYYLYHDIYGNRTYGSVFADYRADRNGRHVIVYGHTLIGGGMFTPLSRMHHQSNFNELGQVYYSTPELGTRAYTPVAAISVTPDYAGVQQFEWEPNEAFLQEARDKILREKKEEGVKNIQVEANASMDPKISTFLGFEKTKDGTIANYYVLTDEDEKTAYDAAEERAYRQWLYALVKDYPAKSSDWVDQVQNADNSVVLACCSWPFNQHRTLIVCVRSDWMGSEN